MKKERKKKPKEIDIALFDHNTVSNFWVKLLLYVKLRPSLESPNYYPPRELSSKELHNNLQILNILIHNISLEYYCKASRLSTFIYETKFITQMQNCPVTQNHSKIVCCRAVTKNKIYVLQHNIASYIGIATLKWQKDLEFHFRHACLH